MFDDLSLASLVHQCVNFFVDAIVIIEIFASYSCAKLEPRVLIFVIEAVH